MSSNVSKSGFRNQEKFFLRNLEPWALKSGNQLKESGIPLTVGIQNPNSTKSGIQYLESRVHSSLTWGDTCTCHMIMLLRHVSFKNCGVCNRELWIFSNFPNTHCEKEAKTTSKISYNEGIHNRPRFYNKVWATRKWSFCHEICILHFQMG